MDESPAEGTHSEQHPQVSEGVTDRLIEPVVGGGHQRLARNAGINLLGYAVPVLVASVAIPYVLGRLGTERFGLLSLTWVILGYLAIFDLGIGRATVRFVAEALGANEPLEIAPILWTSVVFQLLFGSIVGAAVIAFAPHLATILKIPASLMDDAVACFRVLGVTLPFLIATVTLRGFLEAFQRFDLVNAVRIPSSSMLYALPAVGVTFGLGLVPIMELLLASVILTGAAFLALGLLVHPALGSRVRPQPRVLKRLITFGGWVTVSSILVPIIAYSDRVLISALVSVAALAYYTVPYEVVSRLLILPASFGAVLFPAISAGRSAAVISQLYVRATKYLALIVAVPTIVLIVVARPFLTVWVGPAFAAAGAGVMQVLAVGMLLNSIAQIGTYLMDGVNRPDFRAKLFMMYLPVYLVAAWFLIRADGITGAAIAWAVRGVVELLLFTGGAWLLLRFPLREMARRARLGWTVGLIAVFTLAASGLTVPVGESLGRGLIGGLGLACLFAGCAALLALDRDERGSIVHTVTSRTARAPLPVAR